MRPLAIAAVMAANWDRYARPPKTDAPQRGESTIEFAAIRAAEARSERR